jgi:phenylacetate-CoA ligase
MKKLFFLLKNRVFRSYALKAYKEAIQFESLIKEKKRDTIFSLQKKIISSAYKNTKFYKEYYDSKGFHPDMLVTESDWEKIPIIEKEMIRQHTNDFLANEVSLSEMNVASTSGSTGKPLKVFKEKSVPIEILSWRTLRWWGLNESDNHGLAYRSVPKTFLQKAKNKIIWWPTKRIFLDASSISVSNIDRFVRLISEIKIKFLVGYSGSLEKIADYILKNNIDVKCLKMVWSTASPLDNIVRIKMMKAFHCNIMDQYGSNEVFHIAVQKPNESYLTVNADYVHVDIVDAHDYIINDTQEMGDILVTDLHSAKFPLIKYRLGDRSRMIKTIETSEDGFPKIDFVKGRISDNVSFKDGSYLDGIYLTAICDGYEDVINSYQIYQNSEYKVYFRIVLVEGVLQANERVNLVINSFSRLVNAKSEIEIQFVDLIPDERGKRRYIISDVKDVNIN